MEFAGEAGIPQRVVAYYEGPNAEPPVHPLPRMVKVLRVGAEVLLRHDAAAQG